MADSELEAPRTAADLYTSLGGEVDEFRPLFTGDVFEFEGGRRVMVLQHPCAMRGDGLNLADRVLVAEISALPELPARWTGHFRLMPLPALNDPDGRFAGDFTMIEILAPKDFETGKRIAILSQIGVNLLLQRWIHHNSRAIVRTSTINDVTIGPYDEADLTAEWLRECYEVGLDPTDSLKTLDAWLSHRSGKKEPSRRESLADSQARSGVRAGLRQLLRDRVASVAARPREE